ncbi:MAG: CBS domain-containing protein, partial [Burkholderiales bacterium]
MKTVKQLLEGKRHKLISVSPGQTVFDALKKMAENDVGALIVLDGEKLVGVFSERD